MPDDQPASGARREPLDPYAARPLQLIGVVDTNALMSSIENDCRKGYRSRLLRMSDNGAVVLYAADHVYDELQACVRSSSPPRRGPRIVRRSL